MRRTENEANPSKPKQPSISKTSRTHPKGNEPTERTTSRVPNTSSLSKPRPHAVLTSPPLRERGARRVDEERPPRVRRRG
eukprot:5931851-Pyramimonas_sp.AAC.1